MTFSDIWLIFTAMARDIAFLLIPRFSMIALFSALEPLRVANRFAEEVFSWRFVSMDGKAVAASNGIPVSVTAGIDGIGRPDVAIVCASYDQEDGMNRPVFNELRRLARNGTLLGAVDTGAFLLAGAGVLDGHRATCHWETLPAFRENYPDIDAAETTYVIDRGRMTASGGAAALDMMLDWLGSIESEALAQKVADTLVHTRHVNHPGEARVPVGSRYKIDDPRLVKAIRLMEEHVEDTLALSDVAQAAQVSGRQLERLFHKHLQATPARFSLDFRTIPGFNMISRKLSFKVLARRQAVKAHGCSSTRQLATMFSSQEWS